MTNDQLTAIVLAGGKSRRMGRDKALIPIEDVPMLQRICQIAETCAEQVYIVTPWPERYQHLLPPKSQFIQELPLPDETGNESKTHGPLVGFAQGLTQVKTDWVLLLACDLPKLRVEVLQGWISRLQQVPEEAIAALVYRNNRWEPLCGFYRRRCLPELNKYIEQGGRSFQEWLKQYPVQVLPLVDQQMLFNFNSLI
ncbi:molybdenum cofactor guanylyltransferase [Fischerella thermalis]|uniref:molybdenum cofactor guanylyltransferase n=1 Tax=Fischerella thermalis TaxID=372787 RepID=UPI000C7F7B21|nr:molybdenum cofactor guanylyltransferase [Fischerella thermalis]MBF1988515.1 molybdenum cofactor guanylyltransferase [Fischerella thermalis M58_A2018_009]MBF2060596.1 molybdenum cofactor guanylyltransferase [Fischerella thermalis M66_A2018_004]MBF2070765.1 molybdenum cofactor guanylyltransferase [Fischerella thermalis M48_A2018_028]PLZ89794.1 molybdenum cofactor guanylyltransferase [Fischerella thermalis CCMEE 5194]